MGETNSEAIALIENLTGHALENGTHPNGTQFLRIGDIEITANGFALWSDPSVLVLNDSSFIVLWGGRSAIFTRRALGRWSAVVQRNPLDGKARWVT